MSGRIMRNNKTKNYYFEWLCGLVASRETDHHYTVLLKELDSIPFTWLIANDDNRARDGIGLREEYADYTGPNRECSMLEMLIALARRIDFELSKPDEDVDFTAKYFWEMIDNLGLMAYDDASYVGLDGTFCCNTIISALLNREYSRTGAGGLFPLKHSREDQRNLEIWYQMNAYIDENYKY